MTLYGEGLVVVSEYAAVAVHSVFKFKGEVDYPGPGSSRAKPDRSQFVCKAHGSACIFEATSRAKARALRPRRAATSQPLEIG